MLLGGKGGLVEKVIKKLVIHCSLALHNPTEAAEMHKAVVAASSSPVAILLKTCITEVTTCQSFFSTVWVESWALLFHLGNRVQAMNPVFYAFLRRIFAFAIYISPLVITPLVSNEFGNAAC